jgi:pimeloyl-ACP methyl ester carboxylesterase
MTTQKWCAAVAAATVLLGSAGAQQSVDAVFKAYWNAPGTAEAAAAAEAIVRSGVSFDEAFARLKRGRVFSSDAPRGIVRLSHRMQAGNFVYTVEAPETYDPARKYQVRFQLHGGVGRPEPRGPASIGSLAGAEQIYVMPNSWAAAPWWHESQIENLRIILDRLKRTYNVDENRVVVSGVSDGGSGVYYIAMRDTTPFASFLPLNGFILILANPSLEIREQLFPNNLLNKPFFIVNGGRDQLYPTSAVEPYVRHLQRGGVSLAYEPQPNGAHNTAWWPDVKDSFEEFVRDHQRDPYPATLTWQTEEPADLKVRTTPAQASRLGRAHWLMIDKLSAPRAENPLSDLNEFAAGESANFGVRTAGMRITSVMKGSNADSLGLLPGDLVERVNGRVIPDGVPLLDLLDIYDSGTRLTFRVNRGGTSMELRGAFQPQIVTKVVPLFPMPRPSGRVDLVREGNTVRATTRGVAAFTLLISPDVFDFTQPIIVIADGRTVFSSRVAKNLGTLMKWAARDNDRTMLFGAEIQIPLM